MIVKSYEINNKTKYNIFLFYGENDGLKKTLIKKILNDEKNKIFKFEENDLINNTELIYNKIFSGSLFEKKTNIIIERITDKSLSLIENILSKKKDDNYIFFLANILDKKSKLRKFFETTNNVGCVACYKDNSIELNKIINNILNKSHIKLSQESINILINKAQGDRQNLLNEINKILNYSINKKNITVDEINKLTSLTENFQFDEIINSCLNGELKKLKNIFEENNFLPQDYIIILRTFSRKINRLLEIKKAQKSEKNLDLILKNMSPPIFWKEKDIVKNQANKWELQNLMKIQKKINEVELECKKNQEISVIITLNFLADTISKINNIS